MAQLRVARSPLPALPVGTVMTLTAERTVIGRDPARAEPGEGFIHIAHTTIDRRHAAIDRTETGYTFTDLGTRSAMFINQTQCPNGCAVTLADGDAIRIADFTFVFEAGGGPNEPVTPRPSGATPSPPA